MSAPQTRPIRVSEPVSEEDLSHWRLIKTFKRCLSRVSKRLALRGSFADSNRLLEQSDYLALFLFGLLNPVIKTMRGLCAASDIAKVQEDICSRPVSLGSFSEAQHVLDPELLQEVFKEFYKEIAARSPRDPELAKLRPLLQDSTLWEALPRMQWAIWRTQSGKAQKAVRLHLSFNVADDKPCKAVVTEGRCCERKAWRQTWQPGELQVGDRNYGNEHLVFGQLDQMGSFFVLRLQESTPIHLERELPVSQEEAAQGILRHAVVQLGAKNNRTISMRVVWVQGPREVLLLGTNFAEEEVSASLAAAIYRMRWRIELFFRWIKCILGCRHWLAESQKGVTIQVYLALIGSLLLQQATGQRPTKRMMERIQLFMMGVATEEELEAGLARELEAQRRKNRKKAP